MHFKEVPDTNNTCTEHGYIAGPPRRSAITSLLCAVAPAAFCTRGMIRGACVR
jgi:hypothetical protein